MPLDTATTKAQCIFCHHACCICRRVGASKYILAFRHCIANCWVTLCSTSILYPASKSSNMIQNLQVAYWVDATLRTRNISSKPVDKKFEPSLLLSKPAAPLSSMFLKVPSWILKVRSSHWVGPPFVLCCFGDEERSINYSIASASCSINGVNFQLYWRLYGTWLIKSI